MAFVLGGLPIIPNTVQHEYILTEDQKPHLRSALEGLFSSIKDHDERNPYLPFDFQWSIGRLLAYSTSGDIFEDAPTYRVTPGLNFRILKNLTNELLNIPNKLDNIRSVTWNGEYKRHSNIVVVSSLEIVESVVPRIIDLSDEHRCISPLHEWDDVRIGGILEYMQHLKQYVWNFLFTRPGLGPMYGVAHVYRERTRYVCSHLWFEGEKRILYTFESSRNAYAVFDPCMNYSVDDDMSPPPRRNLKAVELFIVQFKSLPEYIRIAVSMMELFAAMLSTIAVSRMPTITVSRYTRRLIGFFRAPTFILMTTCRLLSPSARPSLDDILTVGPVISGSWPRMKEILEVHNLIALAEFQQKQRSDEQKLQKQTSTKQKSKKQNKYQKVKRRKNKKRQK